MKDGGSCPMQRRTTPYALGADDESSRGPNSWPARGGGGDGCHGLAQHRDAVVGTIDARREIRAVQNGIDVGHAQAQIPQITHSAGLPIGWRSKGRPSPRAPTGVGDGALDGAKPRDVAWHVR